MASYRDLPRAEHDMHVMTDGRQLRAFEQPLAVEQELLALLQRTTEEGQRMLAEMRGH